MRHRIALFVVFAMLAAIVKADDTRPALLDPTEHPNRKCPVLNGGTGVYWDSSYFWLGRHFVNESKVGDERAGNPHSISPLCGHLYGPYDDGYYVGGGCPNDHKADVRRCNEGTWGWDYVGHGGILGIPNVDLGYWHGRRDQSGTYTVDGPKIFHHE